MSRLTDLRDSLTNRAITALSSWANVKQPRQLRPHGGRFQSGTRDDYDVDNYVRKATPERLGRALKQADQGDTYQQYEVFEEAERDPVVGRCYFKRRLAVTSKDLQLVPAVQNDSRADQAAELANELILGTDGRGGIKDFDKSLFHLTDGIGKAFAVAQTIWKIEGGKYIPKRLEHWPQREFILGDPHKVYDVQVDEIRIITEQNRSEGLPLDTFPAGTWITHIQKAFSQPLARAALFRSVVWYWLFKRFGTSDWSIFLERYGIPPREGIYGPNADQAERDRLWDAVLNMGKDHACIHSDSTTIQLLETKGLTSGAPHPKFIEYCNDQITIAISGNTMATTQGDRGARSAKEAFQWDEDKQTVFDCAGLAHTLREQLVAPLINLNLGPDWPVPMVQFQFEDTEDLNERAKRDEILHRMGKAVPVAYVEQTYSIPEPEEGEAVLPGAKKPEPFGQPPEEGEKETAAAGANMGQLVEAARFALREAGLAEKKSSVDWVISQMLSGEE